jgi:hypothetical protein
VTGIPAADREYSWLSPELARKWKIGGRWVMSRTTQVSGVLSLL